MIDYKGKKVQATVTDEVCRAHSDQPQVVY